MIVWPLMCSYGETTPFRHSKTRSATSLAGLGPSSLCRLNSTSERSSRIDDGVGNAATPALRVRRRRLRFRDLHDVGRTGSRRSHSSALDDRPRAYAARRRSVASDRRDRPLRNRRDRRGGDPDDLGRMEPDLPHAKQLCAAARREANAAEWSSLGSAQHSGCSHFSMPGPGTERGDTADQRRVGELTAGSGVATEPSLRQRARRARSRRGARLSFCISFPLPHAV